MSEQGSVVTTPKHSDAYAQTDQLQISCNFSGLVSVTAVKYNQKVKN